MRKLVLLAAFGFFACGGTPGNNPGGPVCGDGKVTDSEGCDDGNTTPGDGCSASCQEELGFHCMVAGAPCVKLLYCGDGIITAPEICDDRNSKGGDGCDGTCHPEPGFNCTTAGQLCVSTSVCGDGLRTGGEQCDLGLNNGTGKGCSTSCMQDDGWTCKPNEARCTPNCGDGKIVGNEQCDLGPNNGPGKGCSTSCTRDPGWVCGITNNVYGCHQAVCGDGNPEEQAGEQCDDGNLVPFDGCSPTCTIEPVCASGRCSATCGDGLVFAPEQCDDGNRVDGDGCDHNCQLEDETVTGFHCDPIIQQPPPTLVIPILYRDMRYSNLADPNGHDDFEHFSGNTFAILGLVKDTLGADNKPEWRDNFGFKDSSGTPNTSQALTGPADFCWWYHDNCAGANVLSKRIFLDVAGKPKTLTLNQQTNGANVYEFANQLFFPVDGLGWNDPGSGITPQVDDGVDGQPHNFSFTSELHYPFTYQKGANPKFDFIGDDDVWVFINGHLAVDLGGIHGATDGTASVVLDDAHATQFGLTDKGMYSIDMFQAERHTKQSTYHLTLSGFVHASSKCGPICGDGKVVGDEVCDDGVDNGKDGFCKTDCTGRIARCGNGILEPGEDCDNGVNDGTYGTCAPGCKLAPYCGDSKVTGPPNGPEQCDNGPQNVPLDTYDKDAKHLCTVACTAAPRCGDGIVEAAFGEQCEGGAGCFDCKYAVIN